MTDLMVTPGTFASSPIIERPRLVWPNRSPVAVVVLMPAEHVEWLPPHDSLVPPSVVHRPPYPSIPDVHEVSPHEYGNRVGIFRLGRILADLKIPATVPMDSFVARDYPFLVRYCQSQSWEVIGHGISGSRTISEAMSEAEERAYLHTALGAVETATDVRPRGWSGVGYQESTRTIGLLAENRVEYVVDWANDEQPYWMSTPRGQIVSLPVAIHTDDVYAQRIRRVQVGRWAQIVRDAFDRLVRDGTESARVMVIPINPWMSGQPHRIGHVRSALEHIASHGGAWFATASEVVDAFVNQEAAPSDSRVG